MLKLATAGLMLGLLSPAPPAIAVPHVYTDVVLGVSDLAACVDNAKKVASKNGFTEDVQVLGSGNSRDVYASHTSKPLSLAISCSSELGAASIAVAGMNNDDAFKTFKKVYDDF